MNFSKRYAMNVFYQIQFSKPPNLEHSISIPFCLKKTFQTNSRRSSIHFIFSTVAKNCTRIPQESRTIPR